MNKIIGSIAMVFLSASLLFANNFILHLKLSKHKVYMTQPVVATLSFGIKKGTPLLSQNVSKFKQINFWVKELNVSKPYNKNGYMYQDYRYLIFPQQSGFIALSKQMADVAVRQAKTNFTIWKKIYSNQTTLNVLPLPQHLNIQGNYTISQKIDKSSMLPNGAVNLTLSIKGVGDIGNIKPFSLKIPGAVVYTSTPFIKTYYKKGIYGGVFVQTFSITADKSFTIPSVHFSFFNPKSNEIQTLSTKKISIHVKSIFKEPWYLKYIFAIGGFLLCLLFCKMRFMPKEVKIKPIKIKIKQAKGDKELYRLLLCYANDDFVQETLKKLEANIYKDAKNKIDKKALIVYLSGEL